MAQNRRMFLQCLSVFCLEGAFAPVVLCERLGIQSRPEQQLKSMLLGSWKLQSYTYTSNNKTYASPDEMEAVANFAESRYDVNFLTYISRMGIKRTRRASESGTYSVTGNRIRLFAEEASRDAEKGEEFLTDVKIEGDTMKLTSNNGANHEVWKKVQSTSEDQLKSMLRGSWKLQSYTYTSNNRTYTSPDEMEAVANFVESRYDVNFSTYISAVGIKRTRRASESGTYSVTDNRVRLFAEEASKDAEKGEEFLTDVRIEDETMKLISNNGANHEVWKKVS